MKTLIKKIKFGITNKKEKELLVELDLSEMMMLIHLLRDRHIIITYILMKNELSHENRQRYNSQERTVYKLLKLFHQGIKMKQEEQNENSTNKNNKKKTA